MNLKKALYDYPHLEREIKRLNAEYEDLKANKYNTKITSELTGMPRGSGISEPVYKSVERIIMEYDRRLKDIADRTAELLETRRLIGEALEELDLDERKIIELRCFEGRKWSDIVQRTHFSRASCFRIFGDGYEKIKCKVCQYGT